ncbi:MAG: hypothetical protein H8E44_11600 [Planctomycetes bacterium]|nr:hypothetical protein [Planctomycetota bacterium]MBL7038546.1 hypothetical protein [Pirellulaceae bacterium]
MRVPGAAWKTIAGVAVLAGATLVISFAADPTVWPGSVDITKGPAKRRLGGVVLELGDYLHTRYTYTAQTSQVYIYQVMLELSLADADSSFVLYSIRVEDGEGKTTYFRRYSGGEELGTGGFLRHRVLFESPSRSRGTLLLRLNEQSDDIVAGPWTLVWKVNPYIRRARVCAYLGLVLAIGVLLALATLSRPEHPMSAAATALLGILMIAVGVFVILLVAVSIRDVTALASLILPAGAIGIAAIGILLLRRGLRLLLDKKRASPVHETNDQ